MGRIVDEELWRHVRNYFTVYLPQARGSSPHTIRSYQKSLDSFLDFVAKWKEMPLSSVTFSMLNSEMLSLYLDDIERNGASVSTRNHRLNGIRAFFGYVSKVDTAKMAMRSDIEQIPLKKATTEKIEYLSEPAIKALLEQPDAQTKKGLRDRMILLLMYDTAARINGIVNLNICDIAMGRNPVVTLHEKGSKVNTVPIMKQTVEHIHQYMAVYHPDESVYGQSPLFYSLRDGEKCRLDASTIRKFMKRYAQKARETCIEIPDDVHPHLLRHSRAMHLYQHGMDLTLVSQWLGHSRLETTLVYAHADTEQKRKAIEAATSSDSPLHQKLNATRFTITDDEMLKKLYGLK